jgi:hypothetical protein
MKSFTEKIEGTGAANGRKHLKIPEASAPKSTAVALLIDAG